MIIIMNKRFLIVTVKKIIQLLVQLVKYYFVLCELYTKIFNINLIKKTTSLSKHI